MVGRIDLTPPARADLVAIWIYIARETSPATADRMLDRLEKALRTLGSAPRAGRVRKEYKGLPRSWSVAPYVIIYLPLPKEDGIVVWRVVHGARKLTTLIHAPQ